MSGDPHIQIRFSVRIRWWLRPALLVSFALHRLGFRDLAAKLAMSAVIVRSERAV